MAEERNKLDALNRENEISELFRIVQSASIIEHFVRLQLKVRGVLARRSFWNAWKKSWNWNRTRKQKIIDTLCFIIIVGNMTIMKSLQLQLFPYLRTK